MNRDRATILITNLIERARSAQEKTFVTKLEVDALEYLLGADDGNAVPTKVVTNVVSLKPLIDMSG